MYDIISGFLGIRKHMQLASYSAAIAGLCAVFLAIPVPSNLEAKSALAYVQLFWLALFTVVLTSLFTSFVKFVWHKERSTLPIYDLPVTGIFSLFTGAILFGVIFNIWRFMLNLYAESFAVFTVNVGFPAAVVLGTILIAIKVEKKKEQVPLIWRLIFNSLVVGILVGIAGLYIGVGITHIFYPFWLLKVAPITTLVFFVILLGLVGKKQGFKTLMYPERD